MTIKRKLVLGATTTFCALALTVPMSFAACPVEDNCGCDRTSQTIVTPDNATCSKCKQNPCACEKKNFFSNLFNRNNDDCGCTTGAAAPVIEFSFVYVNGTIDFFSTSILLSVSIFIGQFVPSRESQSLETGIPFIFPLQSFKQGIGLAAPVSHPQSGAVATGIPLVIPTDATLFVLFELL